MGGVGLGLVLGQLDFHSCRPNARSCLVLVMFWTGAIALWCLQLAVYFASGLGHGWGYIWCLVLMTVSGSCSLGFVNVALPLVCKTALPMSESRSGGVTELLGFGLGAALTQ